MVPHPNGKHLLAEVSPVHCVSCGICGASCADYAVGPPGRNASDQLGRIRAFCEENLGEAAGQSILVFGCTHNDSVPEFLHDYAVENQNVHYYGLNCCGTLHSETLEHALESCGGLLLVGCAARNCMNRDGLDLLTGRLYGKRVPFLDRKVDNRRIVVGSHSEHEKAEIVEKLEGLQDFLRREDGSVSENRAGHGRRIRWYLKRTIATALLMIGMALVSQASMGNEPQVAGLRVLGRLPGQIKYECRPLTEEEKSRTPAHMRRDTICESETVNYTLLVSVDGQELLRKNLASRSLRGELPVLVNEEIMLTPGEREIEVVAEGKGVEKGDARRYHSKELISFALGEVRLIMLGADSK